MNESIIITLHEEVLEMMESPLLMQPSPLSCPFVHVVQGVHAKPVAVHARLVITVITQLDASVFSGDAKIRWPK